LGRCIDHWDCNCVVFGLSSRITKDCHYVLFQ
jgi:hypothetical protein